MTDQIAIALCGISHTEARMIELVLHANRDDETTYRIATDLNQPAQFALIDMESVQGMPQFTRWRARYPQIIPITISETGLGGPGPLRLVSRQVLHDLPHLMRRAVSQWIHGARVLPEVAITNTKDDTQKAEAAKGSAMRNMMARVTGEQKSVSVPLPNNASNASTPPTKSNSNPQASAPSPKSAVTPTPVHAPPLMQEPAQELRFALIVHPDATRRRELALLLVAQGIKCWQADSRISASAAIAEHRFGLALVAAELSDGDGYGLCHDWKLNRSLQAMGVIVLAKSQNAFTKARATFSRCDLLLIEPVSDQQLQPVIERFAKAEAGAHTIANAAVDGLLQKALSQQTVQQQQPASQNVSPAKAKDNVPSE